MMWLQSLQHHSGTCLKPVSALGFYLICAVPYCSACGLAQVSINLDAQKANSLQNRINGWGIYPREILSLLTVRKELQHKQSNLKYGLDLELYLKSQENPVAVIG